MNITVYGAASDLIDKSFISSGEQLGKEIALRGHTVLFGGGACGMMGAVARGAFSEGGKIIGITPSFFNIDGALFEHCKLIYTKTMSERKTMLEEKADAFLITPGGIGTFDEFFEVITLRQLKIHKKPIAVFNINNYFAPMLDMLENAVNNNFMPAENMKLYFTSDDPDEILEYLINYHCQE